MNNVWVTGLMLHVNHLSNLRPVSPFSSLLNVMMFVVLTQSEAGQCLCSPVMTLGQKVGVRFWRVCVVAMENFPFSPMQSNTKARIRTAIHLNVSL